MFNVKNLSSCFVDADVNLRVSSFQLGEIATRGSESNDIKLTDLTLMGLTTSRREISTNMVGKGEDPINWDILCMRHILAITLDTGIGIAYMTPI